MPSPTRQRKLLGGDPDKGAAHAPVTYELAEHESRGIEATAKQMPCAPMMKRC